MSQIVAFAFLVLFILVVGIITIVVMNAPASERGNFSGRLLVVMIIGLVFGVILGSFPTISNSRPAEGMWDWVLSLGQGGTTQSTTSQPTLQAPDLTGVRWHDEEKSVVTFSNPPAGQVWIIDHKDNIQGGEQVTGNRYQHMLNGMPKDMEDVEVYLGTPSTSSNPGQPTSWSVKLTPQPDPNAGPPVPTTSAKLYQPTPKGPRETWVPDPELPQNPILTVFKYCTKIIL